MKKTTNQLNYSIYNNQKVLVTGGAGFIGSNICDSLIEYGFKTTCIDNLSSGQRKNIEHLLSNPLFTFIEGDIRDFETCIIATLNQDIVIHEAALGSVPRSIKDPSTTTEVNIGGFVKMLQASVQNNVKRFVYAASSSTYGDHPDLPKVEDKIGKPLSPYAITKYVNEMYAENFNKVYGLDTIGLRYFNVYGKRQDPNGAYAAVIPKFINQLINHQSPIINGDGSHSRDFTYIANVVQANLLAAFSENKEALNNVYNVAHGENTTLIELINLLKQFLSKYDPKIEEIEKIFAPERAGDVKHSMASIEKIKNNLGYNPTHNFKSGLEEAIDWYWHNMK